MGDMLKKAYDDSMLDCPEKSMTSKLKCPVCQQDLGIILCDLEDFLCPGCGMWGSEKLWQELIRTKKQLEMAINIIDTCRQYERGTAVIAPDNLAVYCDMAIQHIQELDDEQ